MHPYDDFIFVFVYGVRNCMIIEKYVIIIL